MRTALTLLGIAIGIAAIVTLVALSKGIVANYSQVIGRTADSDVTLQAVQGKGQAIQLGTGFDQSILAELRRMPEVRAAGGMLFTMASVPGSPFFMVYGYEPDQPGITHFRIVDGVTLGETRTRRGGKPLLLGSVAADKMAKSVGDTIRIEETTFRIVGVFETGVALEDAGAVISLEDAQTLAELPRQVMYVGIRLQQPGRADLFRTKLERLLPDDVEIAGTKAGETMREMLEMLDIYAWGVAMIAALVGGVGMMNAMLMSVFERTREIGVLRAVGWSRWRVLRMILGESLLLSVLGGILGLGMGAGLTWLTAQSPAMAGLSNTQVPPQVIVQSLSMAVFLGLIGGAYPAWMASRLLPIEALRYEAGAGRRRARRLPVGGMALRNLARQTTRTALTVVGVGIGILAMVLIGSVGEGAIGSFNSMMAGAEITAAEAEQVDTSLSTISERDMKRIQALPEVHKVTGLIFSVVSIPNESFFIINARARNDTFFTPHILADGSFINGRRQVLLGWKAAAQHGKGVGDKIEMLGTKFKVVGIISTGTTFDDNGATIDLREAQRLLNKPRQVMIIQIKLVDPLQTEAVLPKLRAAYPKLTFAESSEFAQNLPDMQMTEGMIQSVYLMTMLIGAIALMNTMIMSIHERTREIGVLRSVGWTRSMILRQIMTEGVLLTVLSGSVAILCAYGVIQLLRAMPSVGVYRDMFTLTPGIVQQALALSVMLGLLGGLYPAWRATRFQPVEALRYE